MLKNKELKKKRKEVEKIEAQWSKAQHDVIKSKIAISNSKADILAREQTKNKAMSLCADNGRQFKYKAPISSQEQSILRREIKFKKLLFSDLPSNFSLFKQYNISAKVMYQNLLKLHAVDEVNQETISVEDIYEITDILSTLTIRKSKSKSKISAETSASADTAADLEWPP